MDLADAARFAYLTAWRKGEVQILEWRDVTLDRQAGAIVGGTIRLRSANSKTKRPRPLVLRGQLLRVIQTRLAARRLDCPYVFHRDGRRLGDFRKPWRTACRAAGVPGRLFHDMRRSAVRNLVRAGVPEKVAMTISGHKTRSVFDRYNIVSEDDLAAAADRVTAYVATATTTPAVVAPLGCAEHAQNAHTGEPRTAAGSGNCA